MGFCLLKPRLVVESRAAQLDVAATVDVCASFAVLALRLSVISLVLTTLLISSPNTNRAAIKFIPWCDCSVVNIATGGPLVPRS